MSGHVRVGSTTDSGGYPQFRPLSGGKADMDFGPLNVRS